MKDLETLGQAIYDSQRVAIDVVSGVNCGIVLPRSWMMLDQKWLVPVVAPTSIARDGSKQFNLRILEVNKNIDIHADLHIPYNTTTSIHNHAPSYCLAATGAFRSYARDIELKGSCNCYDTKWIIQRRRTRYFATPVFSFLSNLLRYSSTVSTLATKTSWQSNTLAAENGSRRDLRVARQCAIEDDFKDASSDLFKA